jgi:TRAP transporter 4TM/12TM fusion protein
MSLARSVGGFFFDIGGRRRLGGAVGHMIRAYAAAVALWSFYAAAFSRIDSLALTVIFLCLMLAPAFLMIRASNAAPADRAPLYDWALFAASLACAAYFIASIETIATRISLFFPLTEVQVGFATLVVVLALEITRRTVGLFLMLLVLVFIAYNLWGHLIDGALGHGYISFNHFLDINIYTTDGLFGVPVRVAATYAFLFVMFGTFLEKAGGGAFFFNISAALAGRTPGGPAKVAVVSSALFGTMSGSPTADVVTTGSITIPMMRRLGYRASLAGGVEVAASTGGSILPPVMGSAAFIMAELTGIDYAVIVFAAIIPAALYYLGIVVQVHLRSVGLGLRAMSAEEVPSALATLREGWIYFIPLGVLVAALAQGYSPTMVAAIATLSVIATSWLKPSARLGPRAIYEALSETVVRMLGVTGACAAAGLVIGGITMTGLAAKFSTIAFAFAGDWMFLALLLSAGVTILLGLGMPTPSAYVLAAVLIGPTLVNEFGIPLLNAHMFLMYFAVMSAMTPPVAVAAYAAAAIAMANPLAIAATAVRLALVAFVMPFAFVYAPALLEPQFDLRSLGHVASALGGTLTLAVAAEGRLWGPMGAAARLAMAAAGLLLFSASFLAAGLGLGLAAAALAAHRVGAARRPDPLGQGK